MLGWTAESVTWDHGTQPEEGQALIAVDGRDMERRQPADGMEDVLVPGARPPKDRYNAVYIIFFMLGLGMLLPWNIFITANMYFRNRFAKSSYEDTFENYFSVASMVPNVVFQLLNIFVAHKVSLNLRMVVPLITMLVCFIVTAIMVWVRDISTIGFFLVTIFTVVVINLASAIMQGGSFGVAGKFPGRYTQAIMSGQALAGVFSALASILSLAAGGDPTHSGFGYFLTAVAAIVVAMVSYLLLNKFEYARFYLQNTQELPSLSKDASSPGVNGAVPAADVSDLTGSGAENMAVISRSSYLQIFRKIWMPAVSVMFTFLVTLSVFPSVSSLIESVSKSDGSRWTGEFFIPVTCFLFFNLSDLAGRIIAGAVQFPKEKSVLLPILVLLRTGFMPLFMFCNAQPEEFTRHLPVVFDSDAYPIVFMVLMGVSNGYLGSLCMMYGPRLVAAEDAETAGITMSAFLTLGLGLGAAFSFALTASI
ncbi:equilibrative nucleoside transporter 1-like [Branchiostoma lanceolatum]|uniref:equilibrative nucleoside transporter 1-like n=1 Tax=Branchiostoma lanceolatum TaxID=7740 RepID=UPI003455129B